jgi:hypothetical protein
MNKNFKFLSYKFIQIFILINVILTITSHTNTISIRRAYNNNMFNQGGDRFNNDIVLEFGDEKARNLLESVDPAVYFYSVEAITATINVMEAKCPRAVSLRRLYANTVTMAPVEEDLEEEPLWKLGTTYLVFVSKGKDKNKVAMALRKLFPPHWTVKATFRESEDDRATTVLLATETMRKVLELRIKTANGLFSPIAVLKWMTMHGFPVDVAEKIAQRGREFAQANSGVQSERVEFTNAQVQAQAALLEEEGKDDPAEEKEQEGGDDAAADSKELVDAYCHSTPNLLPLSMAPAWVGWFPGELRQLLAGEYVRVDALHHPDLFQLAFALLGVAASDLQPAENPATYWTAMSKALSVTNFRGQGAAAFNLNVIGAVGKLQAGLKGAITDLRLDQKQSFEAVQEQVATSVGSLANVLQRLTQSQAEANTSLRKVERDFLQKYEDQLKNERQHHETIRAKDAETARMAKAKDAKISDLLEKLGKEKKKRRRVEDDLADEKRWRKSTDATLKTFKTQYADVKRNCRRLFQKSADAEVKLREFIRSHEHSMMPPPLSTRPPHPSYPPPPLPRGYSSFDREDSINYESNDFDGERLNKRARYYN